MFACTFIVFMILYAGANPMTIFGAMVSLVSMTAIVVHCVKIGHFSFFFFFLLFALQFRSHENKTNSSVMMQEDTNRTLYKPQVAIHVVSFSYIYMYIQFSYNISQMYSYWDVTPLQQWDYLPSSPLPVPYRRNKTSQYIILEISDLQNLTKLGLDGQLIWREGMG